MPNDEDWAFARRLDAAYDRLDFRGLLDLYFDQCLELTPVLRQRQVDHILTAPGRVRGWLDRLGDRACGPLLDLGCGSGSFLAAVGRGVESTAGVDIAMRWLIVARKRLDHEGLSHVPLACACAEDLPVADACLAGVVAGDVIEHVADQGQTIAEAYRVLSPGGRLFMASPNRFSLTPEPHVNLWGVGFLPRGWMAPYVNLRRGIDFRSVRNLGIKEWRDLLARTPFGRGRLVVPTLTPEEARRFGAVKRAVARLYNAVVVTGPGQAFARRFGPLFHVVCEKWPVPSPTNRAIRQRSRPSTVRG
jgi:SAM-dependent methyltransferase